MEFNDCGSDIRIFVACGEHASLDKSRIHASAQHMGNLRRIATYPNGSLLQSGLGRMDLDVGSNVPVPCLYLDQRSFYPPISGFEVPS
jgi:hypothetical protein